MALMNAIEFIKNSGREDIKEKLQGVRSTTKKGAIAQIVEIGQAAGFEFTAEEYEKAAGEISIVLAGDNKSIDEIQTTEHSAANCSCTGCAACATCTTCLVCISCSWCIVIPIGGEAAIAADAAAVISTATSLATSVSTSVAVAVQGG